MSNRIAFIVALALCLTACSSRVYTSSLSDQRIKHTQRITSKDVSKGRIFCFVGFGLALWLALNFEQNGL